MKPGHEKAVRDALTSHLTDPRRSDVEVLKKVGIHTALHALFDNDTRILFTIVFDGDFKPYIKDILKEAGPWLDQIFVGVWDGFKGSNDAESVERLLGLAVEAELFFVANPDVTVRDVAKMHRLSTAVNELLDAAS